MQAFASSEYSDLAMGKSVSTESETATAEQQIYTGGAVNQIPLEGDSVTYQIRSGGKSTAHAASPIGGGEPQTNVEFS
ncbi:hypothetical protein [Paenibacillus herberti]|uniref:Uncharacterized protein n=1 Tax=Paenibacillus herberti TaxID=1619309 RepID=A0A229NVV8_9BACL|nr:hypothetical protein [Paenibacillus herberti]OXM14001.1 hypothetical protein CGZ75_13445 [Paenibacillus herberti]